jgi:hypothetical protein
MARLDWRSWYNRRLSIALSLRKRRYSADRAAAQQHRTCDRWRFRSRRRWSDGLCSLPWIQTLASGLDKIVGPYAASSIRVTNVMPECPGDAAARTPQPVVRRSHRGRRGRISIGP